LGKQACNSPPRNSNGKGLGQDRGIRRCRHETERGQHVAGRRFGLPVAHDHVDTVLARNAQHGLGDAVRRHAVIIERQEREVADDPVAPPRNVLAVEHETRHGHDVVPLAHCHRRGNGHEFVQPQF